jgi:cyanophycinase
MLKYSGQEAPSVLVVPQASTKEGAGEAAAKPWRELAVKAVIILDLSDPQMAALQVESADVIWISGGSQLDLMRALKDTPVPAALRARYQSGGVIGGSSAGAAVLSEQMISGNAELKRIRKGATLFHEGLGLWPVAIVDQHFLQRQRFNRLLSAVLDRPDRLGVGIDEATAVWVSGGRFEVIGVNSVVVLDARRVPMGAPDGKKGRPASVSDLRLHVLVEGMGFNIKTGDVTQANPTSAEVKAREKGQSH